MKIVLIMMLSMLLMAACSPGNPPDIAKDQRSVLDKSKTVDTTVQKSADETRQKIDEQSQ